MQPSVAEVCLGLKRVVRPGCRRQRPIPFAYPSPTLDSRGLPRPTREWSPLGVSAAGACPLRLHSVAEVCLGVQQSGRPWVSAARGLSPSAEFWVSGAGGLSPSAELKRRRSRIRSTAIPAFYSPNSAARSFIAPSTVWT